MRRRQFVLQSRCLVFIYLMASLVRARAAQTCFFRSAALPRLHGKAADHRLGGPRYQCFTGHLRPWFALPNSQPQTAPLAAAIIRLGAMETVRFAESMPCFHILNGFARKNMGSADLFAGSSIPPWKSCGPFTSFRAGPKERAELHACCGPGAAAWISWHCGDWLPGGRGAGGLAQRHTTA